ADDHHPKNGQSICVITYGMGVHWSLNAAKNYPGKVTIVDLRTLHPIDFELVKNTVDKHGRCLVVTEEPANNSFAQALSGRIQSECFEWLDAPVRTIGSEELPAIPLNSTLEAAMIPSAEKVAEAMKELFRY